jgi:hypothetical protein
VRRRIIAIVLPVAVLLAAPTLASAGGSWLMIDPAHSDGAGGHGPWDAWGGWGASVAMRSELCLPEPEISNGPWNLVLEPEAGGTQISVGQLTAGPGLWEGCYDAWANFTVPEVPSGRYVIDVCRSGDCSAFFADLIGGYLTIAPSSREARLMVQVGNLRQKIESQQGTLDTRERKLRTAEASLARLEDRIAALRDRAADLDQQVGFAREQRDQAAEDAVDVGNLATEAQGDARRWRLIGTASLAALMTVLAVGWLRSRNTVRIKIPDSPEELIMFGAPKESPPGPKRRSA